MLGSCNHVIFCLSTVVSQRYSNRISWLGFSSGFSASGARASSRSNGVLSNIVRLTLATRRLPLPSLRVTENKIAFIPDSARLVARAGGGRTRHRAGIRIGIYGRRPNDRKSQNETIKKLIRAKKSTPSWHPPLLSQKKPDSWSPFYALNIAFFYGIAIRIRTQNEVPSVFRLP